MRRNLRQAQLRISLVLGKGQSWLKVAHQLVSAHELFSPLAAAKPWGGRTTHFLAPR